MDMLAKTFHDTEVRGVVQGGQACLVAADVADALGYSRTHDFTRIVKGKYTKKVRVGASSHKRTVIEEPGVWQALATTQKDAAEPFQDWLYETLLPDVRRGELQLSTEQDNELAERASSVAGEVRALRAEIRRRQEKLDEAKDRLQGLLSLPSGDGQPSSSSLPEPSLPEPGLPTEIASGESQADLTDPAVPDVINAARELVLERPLVVFDLETTGIKTESARIVQVAMYRLTPGESGRPVACPDAPSLVTYLDPEEPIPEAASEVNGITTADVTGMPTFGAVADEIADMLSDADLCAYNGASFDIPLLRAEFIRAGYPGLPGPDDRRVVDPYLLERRLMPRSLEAAHQRYTGRELEDAHDADADIRGTWRVLEAQVKRVPSAGEAVTPADLHDFQRGDYLDLQRKLKRDGDKIVVMFGKHQGSSLSWIQEHEPGYLRWMAREVDGLRPHIEQHT